MRFFEAWYCRLLRWSQRPGAPYALAALSFFEAFAFPLMPELMLAPMALARPRQAFRYAHLSLCFSLLGSLVGYALGHWLFATLKPLLARLGWLGAIEHWVGVLQQQAQVHPWSVFASLVLAGFAPVPMKLFSWASGIVGLPLLPFVASMALGRGKRVRLLAWLIRRYGERAQSMLQRYSERIGWTLLVLIVLGLLLWRLAR